MATKWWGKPKDDGFYRPTMLDMNGRRFYLEHKGIGIDHPSEDKIEKRHTTNKIGKALAVVVVCAGLLRDAPYVGRMAENGIEQGTETGLAGYQNMLRRNYSNGVSNSDIETRPAFSEINGYSSYECFPPSAKSDTTAQLQNSQIPIIFNCKKEPDIRTAFTDYIFSLNKK